MWFSHLYSVLQDNLYLCLKPYHGSGEVVKADETVDVSTSSNVMGTHGTGWISSNLSRMSFLPSFCNSMRRDAIFSCLLGSMFVNMCYKMICADYTQGWWSAAAQRCAYQLKLYFRCIQKQDKFNLLFAISYWIYMIRYRIQHYSRYPIEIIWYYIGCPARRARAFNKYSRYPVHLRWTGFIW